MSARSARRNARLEAAAVEEVAQQEPVLEQFEDENPADFENDNGTINVDSLLGDWGLSADQAEETPEDDENDEDVAEETDEMPEDETPVKEFVRKDIKKPLDDEEEEILEEVKIAPVASAPVPPPKPVARRRITRPVEDDEEEKVDVVEKVEARGEPEPEVVPTKSRRQIKRESADEASAAPSAPTPKNNASGSAPGGLFARRAAAQAAAAAASASKSKTTLEVPTKKQVKIEEPKESILDRFHTIADEEGPLEALEQIFPDEDAVNDAPLDEFVGVVDNLAGILGFTKVDSEEGEDGFHAVAVPAAVKGKASHTHACVLRGSCVDQAEKSRTEGKPFALAKDVEFVSEEPFEMGFYVLNKAFTGRDIFAIIKKAFWVLRSRD